MLKRRKTMETVREFKAVCLFCGMPLNGKIVEDDGYDWLGHHRGKFTSNTYIERCNCPLGQLVRKMPSIKPMCKNCKWYSDGCCTNQKEIETVKKIIGNFEIWNDAELSVKNDTVACKNHELDYQIFEELIKKEEK